MMKIYNALLILITGTVISCGVTHRMVSKNPPAIPDPATAFDTPEGEMKPFASLTMFLWPRTVNGRPVTEFERGEIERFVLISSNKIADNSLKKEFLKGQACEVKKKIFAETGGCFDYWVDKPNWGGFNPKPSNPCAIKWIGKWSPEPTEQDKLEHFRTCQALQKQGKDAETLSQELAAEIPVVYQALRNAIDNPEMRDQGPTNWKTFDPDDKANQTDSYLSIRTGDQGETIINMAFRFNGVTYRSEPQSEDEGLIDNLNYNFTTGYLSFHVVEKLPKDSTDKAGEYNFRLSRVKQEGIPLTNFGGKVKYTYPDGRVVDGRFSLSGIFK